jgi:hypothetical protein
MFKKIFKRKQENTEEFKSTESIFEELIKDKTRLWIVIIVMAIFIYHQNKGLQKPPITIRLYGDGHYEVANTPKTKSKVMAEDLPVFVSTFIRRMNFVDSYHLNERIPLGLEMMTKDLREHYLETILTQKTLTKIKNLEWETETKLGKPSFERKADYILCKVTFVRVINDRIKGTTTTQPYLGELKIVLVPRSANHPYGLLVREFKYEQIQPNN